jgi:hypothetical protein
MQQRRGQVGAHALAERKLAHRRRQEWPQAQQVDERVKVLSPAPLGDVVDMAQ